MTTINTRHKHVARKHAAVRTEEYLYNQLIPYIGNKRKLLPLINRAIEQTEVSSGIFVDFFSGSTVVARLAKMLGFQVAANDWEPYGAEISRCFIGCNYVPAFARLSGAQEVFQKLNSVEPLEGYFATYLCPADDEAPNVERERMFFTHRNGAKIDAMRALIAEWESDGLLSPDERSYLLAPLVFAISYVSNTSGVFKGFHNGWGGQTSTALYRILSDIELRQPVLYDNDKPNCSFRLDAQQLAEQLRVERRVDLAYLDPPYNQHPYGSNYHVLNTLVLRDDPPTNRDISEGNKSAIRTDWRTERRSLYNYADARDAYARLIETIDARFILTSYSTDGNIPLREMLDHASTRGGLACVFDSYKRYRVSSQRMSDKPLNVEFVLTIDTSRKGTKQEAARIYDSIMYAEETALTQHPEVATDNQFALFIEHASSD